MPRKSPSQPTVNPIDALSEQIATSAKRKCGISISSELTKAVRSELKALRTTSAFVLDTSVNIIVSALDENDGACSRLEPSTFTTVLLTLLHAKYSRQKERGIILLAASLHHDTHKTHALRTIVRRKEIIGEDCVRALLPYFTNVLENARIRRWAGVMLLQLLDGTEKNILRFESCTEDSRRALGSMLLEEQNEFLKITCGEILRALINWELKPEHLWPINTDPKLYETFPTSSLSEKHWNNAFQSYIDDLIETSSISQGFGRVYFAQALVLVPTGHMISEGIVNILFDSDISICTQTSGKAFTESLEIPFKLISDTNIEATVWEGAGSSAASAVDLIVNLKQHDECFCYLNALPAKLEGFRITIGNKNDARIIAHEMTEPKRYNKASQSKDMITIGSGFTTTGTSQKRVVAVDDDKEQNNYYNDPSSLCHNEGNQPVEEKVDFSGFIPQPPHSENGEVDAGLSTVIEKLVSEDIIRPTYDNLRADASEPVPFPPSACSTLSPSVRNDRGTSVNKGKGRVHDFNSKDKVSSDGRVGIASVSTRPEALSHEGATEISEPPDSAKIQPLPHSQSRLSSKASQFKAKGKLKRIVPKPKVPNGFQKSKNSPSKIGVEAPLMKTSPSKSTPAPKKSTSKPPISKTGPTVSNQSSASTSKPAGVSKQKQKQKPAPRPCPLPKLSNKLTSKLSVSKKSVFKQGLESPRQKSQKESHGSETHVLDSEIPTTSLEERTAMDFDTGTRETPKPNIGAYYTSQLSQALADLDHTEQIGADFGEMGQLNLLGQPGQVVIQEDDLQVSEIHEAGASLRGGVHYPLPDSPRIAGISSYGKPVDVMVVRSESSPSSMSQRTPLPLPSTEVNTAQAGVPSAANVLPRNLETPTNVRRSPRLAARNRNKEASAISSTAKVAAHHPTRKSASIDRSQVRSHSKHGGSIKNSLSRKSEPTLLNDSLARKTPIISFGINGPRNQGIYNAKTPPLQMIRTEQTKNPEVHSLLPKKFTGPPANKRKHVEPDGSDIEKNKRQQTSRFQKSTGKAQTMGQDLVIESRNGDDHTLSGVHPPMPSNGRYGSQGSRVNENGSPREHNKRRKKSPAYEAVVKKAVTDRRITADNSGGNASSYGHVEGFNIVESGCEIIQEYRASSPNDPKSEPPLSLPDEGAVDPHLSQGREAGLRFRQVETKDLHHGHDMLLDPFIDPDHESKENNFSRILQYHRQTPIRKARDNQEAPISRTNARTVNEDLETTLVDDENESSLLECPSSSDVMSESSDDTQNRRLNQMAQDDFYREQHDLWRKALKPHQKGILDILDQISTDLVRHLVSHEQAIDDVVTGYEQYGIKLIEEFRKSRQENRQQIQLEVSKLMKVMGHGYGEARQEMSRITVDLEACQVREVEKTWIKGQSHMQRLVEEGMKKSM